MLHILYCELIGSLTVGHANTGPVGRTAKTQGSHVLNEGIK
ncbi:hypothetical protein SAMN02745824_1924 [Parasphingorhabdus marina DSM 22363]|uniref:Uncharacterized protein n=1 Tax=Parasphingorhabdus marina DSM 22363 TaxID=1123272 RepID=A0A1N6EHU2_9SPHN|nr:hypothetical protein SAMN02745824_1924 [Parasphingorhabdus marina DSM 22363]